MITYLCIIQARLTSSRLPGKALMTVAGIPIVKRVWNAAINCKKIDKTIVAWPERYPDIDENNVLERFRHISNEFPSKFIIRLTSDCPFLTSLIIETAINQFEYSGKTYYCNRNEYLDGFDVQIFKTFMLHRDYATHKEHVIAPESYTTDGMTKYSIDTKEDLERARKLCKTKYS